jgi:hypothetical protein
MPAAVRIKSGKYGAAIGLLLERGGTFQTRYERTLILNAEQKKALEEAHLIETNGLQEGSGEELGRFPADSYVCVPIQKQPTKRPPNRSRNGS